MTAARHPALRLVRRYVLLPIATVLEAGVHGAEWLFPRGPDEIWTSTMAFDVDVDTTEQGGPAVIFMTTEKNDGFSLEKHANKVTLRLGGLGVLLFLVIARFSREPSVPITLMVLWVMALSLILGFFFNRNACRRRKPLMLRKGYAEVRLDPDGTMEFWASPKDFTGRTGRSMPYTPAITFVVGTYRQLLGSRPTDSGTTPTDEHDPWVVIAQDGLGTAVPIAVHSGSQADMVRLHAVLTEQFAASYERNARTLGKLLKPAAAPVEPGRSPTKPRKL